MKQIVPVDSLDRCFSSEVGYLCPTNVLKTITNLQWLGFARNPELKLSFPRNHLSAPNCDHLHPLQHLGGRSFLSTTSGTITTNVDQVDVSPLAVYNFPWNVNLVEMKTSLATCPETLAVSLSLFSTDTIMYVQCNPDSGDIVPLQLQLESLSVPPPVVINHTVINDFDELYEYYDGQLISTLDEADSMISRVEGTTEITWTDYLAYASCGLSAFNFIIFCVAFRCFHSLVRRRLADKSTALFLESPPPESAKPIVSKPSHSRRVCKRCDKPVKRGHQNTKTIQKTHGPEDKPR